MPPIALIIPLLSGLALLGLGYFALRYPQKAMEVFKSKYRESADLKQFRSSAAIMLFLGCLLLLLSAFGYAALVGVPTGQSDNLLTSASFRLVILRLLCFALFVIGAFKINQVIAAARTERVCLRGDWYLKSQSPAMFWFVVLVHLAIGCVLFLGGTKLWRA